MRVELKNAPDSLMQMEQSKYMRGGHGRYNSQGYLNRGNNNNDFQYKEASLWRQTQEKRSKILMLDKDKKMRRMIKNMGRDMMNADNFEFRKMRMEIVYEGEDPEDGDLNFGKKRRAYGEDTDSEEEARAKTRKKKRKTPNREEEDRESNDDDGDESELSDEAAERHKNHMRRNNAVANYEDLRGEIDEDNLKKGEFLSKGGKIVKPDRNQDRRNLEKKQQMDEHYLRQVREKEMLKEKIKNSNILREVLKKQVKEKQEQKNFKPSDEIEALLIEKYKKEAAKVKVY